MVREANSLHDWPGWKTYNKSERERKERFHYLLLITGTYFFFCLHQANTEQLLS